MDKYNNLKYDSTKEELEIMAVSVKPTPVFTGEAAKKLIEKIEKPTDKTELFKKCEQLSKIFTLK